MRRTEAILEMAREAPVLCVDVVFELGVSKQVASATLRYLEKSGDLKSELVYNPRPAHGRKWVKLYSLPNAGGVML